MKIEIKTVGRQQGNTSKLMSKLFGNPSSILIVHDIMTQKTIIDQFKKTLNNEDTIRNLSERVICIESSSLNPKLDDYKTWYVDATTNDTMSILINILLKNYPNDKILIGHVLGPLS